MSQKEYLTKSTPMSDRERKIAESYDYLLRHADGRKTPLWYVVQEWRSRADADGSVAQSKQTHSPLKRRNL